MRMTRRIWTQLVILALISSIAIAVMVFNYMRLPAVALGVGQYTVTLELAEAAGLYKRANVTYRGVEVGEVKAVELTKTGVEATLLLQSKVRIPSDLQAQVHSTTALGEQYVTLLPRDGNSTPLKDGDVITQGNATVPPDISGLLDATDAGLAAIPGDDLQTTVDEAYKAFGGLGPEINRFIKGSTTLAIDARENLPELVNVVDNAGAILDSQVDSAQSVQTWADHLAEVTGQLRARDADVQGILQNGPGATDEVRQLFERVQPTVPILAANLASIAPVLVTYRADLEQVLVLLPMGTAAIQGINTANRGTKQAYNGAYLSFNLNLNLPPTCTTGFLPAQQVRTPVDVDAPERPAGDLYCRVPQDSPFNVRGARNTPCETRPGKRAPTVKLCESDEEYVPLNDGMAWKGDPNATLSGQSIPQLPPGTQPPAAPPVAVAQYDPATGTYIGPDGKLYRQDTLNGQAGPPTWQSMLVPPGN